MTTNQESAASSTSQAATSSTEAARARLRRLRWVQLILGVVCMVMIANLQYGWTLFVSPIGAAFGWKRATIQVAFTLFVAAETFLVPVEGWLVDKFGPRIVTICGGVLVAIGWSINSVAASMPVLCIGQVISGIGAGAVYGTCVGNALKWFPDRRGLAAGITAAGFGAGSALTVLPISSMIATSGYAQTFLYFGIGQGLIVIITALFLAQPDANAAAALPKPPKMPMDRPQYTLFQMLGTPTFWIMYLMFVLMAAGGLFVTANLAQVAEDFKVAKIPVTLFAITLPALQFALSLDRIMNGITRPFFGWVSDKLGRENTMFLAFITEAIGVLLLSRLGGNPVAFVVVTGMVFFAWGEIYSLFPSTCADTYGWKFATGNAGALYTAKGIAGFLVPLATLIADGSGWQSVFLASAAMNAAAAIMALAVLKPMRRRMMSKAPPASPA